MYNDDRSGCVAKRKQLSSTFLHVTVVTRGRPNSAQTRGGPRVKAWRKAHDTLYVYIRMLLERNILHRSLSLALFLPLPLDYVSLFPSFFSVFFLFI